MISMSKPKCQFIFFQTKWVTYQITCQLQSRGWPITILRPAHVIDRTGTYLDPAPIIEFFMALIRDRIAPEIDFPTVEFLGNTGAVALPTAFALGVERGQVTAGDRVALLGIGSGLNCLMLGLEW